MLDRSLALRFKSRRGLPRVRTAHNRELIHGSAGEKLRSRSVFISGQASFRCRKFRNLSMTSTISARSHSRKSGGKIPSPPAAR